MQKIDLYEVLGVSPTSDEVVIRAAYKAMMRKYHPDLNSAPDSDERAKAINEAFAILSNPDERMKYDAARTVNGNRESPPPPPPPPPPSSTSASYNLYDPVEIGSKSKTSGLMIALLLCVALTIVLAIINGNHSQGPKIAEESLPDDQIAFSPNPAPSASANLGTAQAELDERVPTIGQFRDKIGIAVEDFASTLVKDGMTGAEIYSRKCRAAALRTNDILETDYCVAFDMSAMATDLGATQSMRLPQNQYFQTRAQSLESDYARFRQASPSRTQIIWSEVNAVLETSIQAAMN